MAFIKRFAPFAIALSLGLFITSFFVDISAPKFKRGHHRQKRHEYMRQLESKVAELERQNAELQSQLDSQNISGSQNYTIKMSTGETIKMGPHAVPVPPPVPAVPHDH